VREPQCSQPAPSPPSLLVVQLGSRELAIGCSPNLCLRKLGLLALLVLSGKNGLKKDLLTSPQLLVTLLADPPTTSTCSLTARY